MSFGLHFMWQMTAGRCHTLLSPVTEESGEEGTSSEISSPPACRSPSPVANADASVNQVLPAHLAFPSPWPLEGCRTPFSVLIGLWVWILDFEERTTRCDSCTNYGCHVRPRLALHVISSPGLLAMRWAKTRSQEITVGEGPVLRHGFRF